MAAPEPLSDDWIAALDEAVRVLRLDGPDPPLRLEYRVADGPTWHVAIDGDGARVHPGPADGADVSFSTDRATALAFAAGDLDPLDAVITGDLSIGGDPRRLVEHQGLLDDLGGLFAGLFAGSRGTDPG